MYDPWRYVTMVQDDFCVEAVTKVMELVYGSVCISFLRRRRRRRRRNWVSQQDPIHCEKSLPRKEGPTNIVSLGPQERENLEKKKCHNYELEFRRKQSKIAKKGRVDINAELKYS